MELWSLMHFLMPMVFSSHSDFKEWFSNPLSGMVEGSQEYNESIVKRLHQVYTLYNATLGEVCTALFYIGFAAIPLAEVENGS
jgi:hypothetical protein